MTKEFKISKTEKKEVIKLNKLIKFLKKIFRDELDFIYNLNEEEIIEKKKDEKYKIGVFVKKEIDRIEEKQHSLMFKRKLTWNKDMEKCLLYLESLNCYNFGIDVKIHSTNKFVYFWFQFLLNKEERVITNAACFNNNFKNFDKLIEKYKKIINEKNTKRN